MEIVLSFEGGLFIQFIQSMKISTSDSDFLHLSDRSIIVTRLVLKVHLQAACVVLCAGFLSPPPILQRYASLEDFDCLWKIWQPACNVLFFTFKVGWADWLEISRLTKKILQFPFRFPQFFDISELIKPIKHTILNINHYSPPYILSPRSGGIEQQRKRERKRRENVWLMH